MLKMIKNKQLDLNSYVKNNKKAGFPAPIIKLRYLLPKQLLLCEFHAQSLQ
jgi:hypothetical protein